MVVDTLKITLLGDGSSDRCLLAHILWTIGSHIRAETVVEPTFMSIPQTSDGRDLKSRVVATLQEAPCNILFIHRDAERESHHVRLSEIKKALNNTEDISVPIIPVRMTEAWLLFDSSAIRHAADNPNGKIQLNIPRLQDIERVADPKKELEGLLCVASEKSGRRLAQFKRDIASRVQ